ncbi:proton/sulfate transporter [Haematococcus lacustris]
MTDPDSREVLWDANRAMSAPRVADYPWDHHDTLAKPWFSPLARWWRHAQNSHQHRRQTYGVLDWAAYVLPCVSWLRVYSFKEHFPGDLVAGLSVGCMIIAQGLSYANLAGVPSVYGLYGAFTPSIVYAVFGTSRQLAVGPVAVTSTLIGSSMKALLPCAAEISNPNNPGPGQQECQDLYNTKVIQLAFIVACMYTGIGVLRLGWVTNLLSHAVISGFTSGAAITIGSSQVKYLLGYSISPQKDVLQNLLAEYVRKARNFKWQEFIMGSVLLLMMVIFKELGKRHRRLTILRTLGPITAVVVGLLTVVIGNVDDQGIRVIGNIPKGLPPLSIHMWAPVEGVGPLLGLGVIVMLVDLLESTSIARALARKNGYELDYNKEITGLGLANFAGALFSSYTTTGSFSRSAINDLAGSKTPLCQFITAWVVGLVLLFLTPLLGRLPYNVLGAVVVASVVSLIDYEQIIYLLRVSPMDALVWLASFLGTLFISVEIGIGIAIGLAVLMALYHIAFPHTALLGRVPGSGVYRSVKQYPDAQVTPGVVSFRIDAPVFFANVKNLQDKLGKIMERMGALAQLHGLPGVQYLVLDLTPVTHVDAMGLHFLEELVFEGRAFGYTVILANPAVKVLREFEPVHLADLIGKENIFVSVADATQYAVARLTEKGYHIRAVPYAKHVVPDILGPNLQGPTPSDSTDSLNKPAGIMSAAGPSIL